MFLTVEIRGAARLVRHSQGEDVSDPVADYECSEAPERPVVVARFDLGRMVREGYREAPVLEARGQRLPDPRVVAGTSATFTGGGSAQDGDDEGGDLRDRPKKVHERLGVPDQGQLLRMAQERPRRLLRRLYAESRRRGPLTLRFVRPLVSGRALVDISVDGPALHAVARLELSGPATTAEALVPPMALVVEVDAELRPTGDLDDIRTQLRGPSFAGGLQADVATRLGAVVTRLCRRPNRRGAVTRLLRTWLQPEPRWAVAVAEQLLAAPETLPLTAGHDAPARPSLTLTDILEQ
ncbi:MAG: hypothetical protein KC933_22415, partial [Myxococcales bacterium]|nr:hypothetical protein [Myxococcales bacterium]